MGKEFHENRFDDGTQVKLAIFRGYIKEWISVFLTEWSRKKNYKYVNIFDFFAGPGTDSQGNLGSPRIIQEELKTFCQTHDNKAYGINTRLFFNDIENEHIVQLKQCFDENACPKNCCEPVFSSMPFQDAFDECLPFVQLSDSANLVIMDQFGVKEVSADIIKQLASCETTDILFFISSSYVRRFCEVPAIQKYFKMNAADWEKSDYNSSHRRICDYFQSTFSEKKEYHLAPFSIKKGSNIYGVIFGSNSLLGLEKFLQVCWKLDGDTGEANYDIDNDPIRFGQLSIFPEENIVKKQVHFERDLRTMLSEKTIAGNNANNLDVYRFTLEQGFLPKHANEILRKFQTAGSLEVKEAQTDQPARKGSFYVDWKYYNDSLVKVVFRQKD